MDDLVDIINQLQDVFLASGSPGIDLPQIVVVGAQSSGKSSVLEHIVGRSFLPRGIGIVTRCPLVLQLVRAPGIKKKKEKAYAIFQQNKEKTYTDYNLIRKEIEEETDRLAGANKGICPTPISLKLHSSAFLNLTLVDLPGLTKVPVGDQPRDIEDQTKKLIMQYIKNPNSIILAVTAANVDMATSESLKIAKEVDPEGKRTLAVITKLDLMDDGTDAWDMLSGKVIPVKLGIIGVVNRSQKDIQDDKSIEQSLKDETEFFNSHYNSIASRNGCEHLKKKVQGILVNHIKNCMPELREKIEDKLFSKKEELNQIQDSELDKTTLLYELMSKFSSSYTSAIKGRLTEIQTKDLYGGATISHVFHDWLTIALNSVDALTGLEKTFIMTAIKNSSGVNTSIFVPEIAFESLVKKQIERLRSPCLNCVDLVYKQLNKIIQDSIEDSDSGLEVYPKMQRELGAVVSELLMTRLPITKEMVGHLIDIQLAYINTVHPDFFPNTEKGLGKLNSKDQVDVRTIETHEDKIKRDYDMIIKLIQSYFTIVRKTIKDTVPKIIMHFFVNYVVKHLQVELMKWLHKSDPEDLLQELDEVVEKRKELKRDIAALEQANVIINKISSVARARCIINFR